MPLVAAGLRGVLPLPLSWPLLRLLWPVPAAGASDEAACKGGKGVHAGVQVTRACVLYCLQRRECWGHAACTNPHMKPAQLGCGARQGCSSVLPMRAGPSPGHKGRPGQARVPAPSDHWKSSPCAEGWREHSTHPVVGGGCADLLSCPSQHVVHNKGLQAGAMGVQAVEGLAVVVAGHLCVRWSEGVSPPPGHTPAAGTGGSCVQSPLPSPASR